MHFQMTRSLALPFLFFFSINIFAWDSVGHRIIAQIAYDQLTPQAKKQIDALTDVMFHSRYPESRFLKASTWPDQIKSQTTQYNAWHFIDLPFDESDRRSESASDHADNVVWAIQHVETVVEDQSQTNQRRAKYLSFLIHFVGDIEQPMHCVTLYDRNFPTGDRGGNDYPIRSHIADNLHQLWDRGLGLFVNQHHHYQFHYHKIQKIAQEWMQRYPRALFKKQLLENNPKIWAEESKQIATDFAYTLPCYAAPSQQYLNTGQTIVQKQIVLAGYRLADILNTHSLEIKRNRANISSDK